MLDSGELYIVASPIGNLEDISLRALRILKEVDIIACENPRHSGILLKHYGIKKRLLSCGAKNEKASVAGLLKLLQEGRSMAYLSDAGTPGISDPGSILVAEARINNITIIPIPGASAFSTLLSLAGASIKNGVTFAGFLGTRTGKRRRQLEDLLEAKRAFVIYEAPHRIIKLLNEINELAPSKKIVLGREMTKKFEQFITGNADALLDYLLENNNIRGEFSLFIAGTDL